jgi:FtsZ-interacting cell division protein ZipA
MQRLADEFMVVATLPDSQTALEQAQQLDKFCVDVDFQIGVNLVSRGSPFPGTKIRALAESAGMTLGVNGLYTRYDDNGLAIFSLQNFEADGFAAETLKDLSTNALVFLLDVPRTPRGQYVYKQMVDTARRFADTLNGMLVDDNRQPLAETQFAHICQEFVIKPQAVLEAAGLPAGGSLALRLFN